MYVIVLAKPEKCVRTRAELGSRGDGIPQAQESCGIPGLGIPGIFWIILLQ